MKRTLLLMLLANVIRLCGFSQELSYYGNLNYKSEVQTVLLYANGNQLEEPVVPLDDLTEKLTLSFDVLNGDGDVLNYTFIHCTYDWQPTEIQRIQYASGFDSDRIDDFSFSVNTLVDYVNYRLVFPKEDMRPLVSGNYLLIVFGDDMSEENIYFTRRFMVVDEKAVIEASVPRYPDDLALTDTHQQLNVITRMGNISGGNVQEYGNLTIRQNGRWDNAAEGVKPSYVYPDYISFEHNPLTVFDGSNQYRRFDISNFRFQSENLAHIYQNDQSYEIDILTCESRANKAYSTYQDIHGAKFIHLEDENLNTSIEADYAKVNFFLRWDAPLPGQEVYVMGAINDWTFNESNRMTYDYKLRGYVCSMLLKQGFYNFMFATLDEKTGEITTDMTAGNFWETNNVYTLYFYYYNPTKGYDELIGYTMVKSH